jgi:hypothetical protein
MQKLLLLSLVLGTVAIPVRASSDKSARRGLKRAIFGVFLLEVFYAFGLLVLYPLLEK